MFIAPTGLTRSGRCNPEIPTMTRAEQVRRGRKAVSAMPLDFIDFAHYYETAELGDVQPRVHFEAFADLMECLVHVLRQVSPADKRLGIRLDDDTLALVATVESQSATQRIFNRAASEDVGGKTAP